MALPWAKGGVPLWGEEIQTCLHIGEEMQTCVRSREEMPDCVLTRTLNNQRSVSAPQGHFTRSPWQRRGTIVPPPKKISTP
jgi:hypothetical protein